MENLSFKEKLELHKKITGENTQNKNKKINSIKGKTMKNLVKELCIENNEINIKKETKNIDKEVKKVTINTNKQKD